MFWILYGPVAPSNPSTPSCPSAPARPIGSCGNAGTIAPSNPSCKITLPGKPCGPCGPAVERKNVISLNKLVTSTSDFCLESSTTLVVLFSTPALTCLSSAWVVVSNVVISESLVLTKSALFESIALVTWVLISFFIFRLILWIRVVL